MSSCASARNSKLPSSVFVTILFYTLPQCLRYFENKVYFGFGRFAVVGDFTRISFFLLLQQHQSSNFVNANAYIIR
jgi:hypothetical protein